MNLIVIAAEENLIKTTLPDWVYDILQDETARRRFWITKGLGAGGTYGLAFWHYIMCLINYRSRFSWSIAPTYQQVADTLIPTFTQVLTEEFLLEEGTDFEVVTSQRPRIALLQRNQEIQFKSAIQFHRLVGPSVSHVSGTECGLWPRQAYEKSSARLRCPRGKRLQYLGEGTPEGFNWWQLEADFDEGVHPEFFNEDIPLAKRKNAARIILETKDNPLIKPGYEEDLEQAYAYDRHKLISYTKGLFTPFTRGSAYWEYHDSRNKVLDVVPQPQLPLIFAWDFNTTPISAVVLQRQAHNKRGYRFHRYVALWETSGKERGLLDGCASFIAEFKNNFKGTQIEIDGGHDGYAGSALVAGSAYSEIQKELSKHFTNVKVTAARSAPTIKDSLSQINKLFAYEQYVVAAWCKNLIKGLSQSNLKDGVWEFEKKKGSDPTHFPDGPRAALFNRTKNLDLENPNQKVIHGTN